MTRTSVLIIFLIFALFAQSCTQALRLNRIERKVDDLVWITTQQRGTPQITEPGIQRL